MSKQVMTLPTCPANKEHGSMELRKETTKEQSWCGTWYDCVGHHCDASILLKSPELQDELSRQAQEGKNCEHP